MKLIEAGRNARKVWLVSSIRHVQRREIQSTHEAENLKKFLRLPQATSSSNGTLLAVPGWRNW